MLGRIDSFLQAKQKDQEEDYESELAELIMEMRDFNRSRDMSQGCTMPCCKVVEENIPFKTKALSLRKSTDARRASQIYKSDKSEEYFNRYYRKSEFDMHRVLNVEKTKMQ